MSYIKIKLDIESELELIENLQKKRRNLLKVTIEMT